MLSVYDLWDQIEFILFFIFILEIYGIWFYDKDECARIGQLMNRYVEHSTKLCQKQNCRTKIKGLTVE